MIIDVYCPSNFYKYIKFQTDSSVVTAKVNYSRWVPYLIKNKIKWSFQSVGKIQV